MQRNYGYLDGYSGSNPREYLTDVTDPYVLQYYATELNHAMKRALYCIVSPGHRFKVSNIFSASFKIFVFFAAASQSGKK